jgi:hypothetical protein
MNEDIGVVLRLYWPLLGLLLALTAALVLRHRARTSPKSELATFELELVFIKLPVRVKRSLIAYGLCACAALWMVLQVFVRDYSVFFPSKLHMEVFYDYEGTARTLDELRIPKKSGLVLARNWRHGRAVYYSLLDEEIASAHPETQTFFGIGDAAVHSRGETTFVIKKVRGWQRYRIETAEGELLHTMEWPNKPPSQLLTAFSKWESSADYLSLSFSELIGRGSFVMRPRFKQYLSAQKVGKNIVDSSAEGGVPWRGFWSLADMLVKLGMLAEALERMRHARFVLNALPLDELITGDQQVDIAVLFAVWQTVSREAGFANCLTTTEHTIGKFERAIHASIGTPVPMIKIAAMTARQALTRIDQLDENYRRDVGERFVWLLDVGRSSYFDGERAKSVAKAFPSAIPEMEEANRCHALSRDTASVFHLMRAVEHVLRVLVVSVGVSTPSVPLDYQEWQNLIEQLDSSQKAAIVKWSRPHKTHAHQFFSRVVADLFSFKDDVRNVLMHTRSGGTYDAPGALSVRNRVEQFFEFVSARTDENVTVLLDQNLFAKP